MTKKLNTRFNFFLAKRPTGNFRGRGTSLHSCSPQPHLRRFFLKCSSSRSSPSLSFCTAPQPGQRTPGACRRSSFHGLSAATRQRYSRSFSSAGSSRASRRRAYFASQPEPSLAVSRPRTYQTGPAGGGASCRQATSSKRSMTLTAIPGRVAFSSRTHFSTSCPGHMTTAR